MRAVRLASIMCYEIMAGDNSCWQPIPVRRRGQEYARRAESL